MVEQSSLDSDATMMMRVPQCPDQQCCQQKVSQAQFLCQPLLWILSPSPPFLFVLWEDETTTMLSPSMPCSWRLDLAVSQKQDKGQGGIGALKHTSPKSLLCQAQETQQFEKKNATLGWSARDICASAPSDSITILS